MKHYVLAIVLSSALTGSALAAHEPVTSQMPNRAPVQHFAVKDTVGTCSVIDTQPSQASDLKILGSKNGYSSVKDAVNALGSGCKDKIDRG
jgi:hypothetical protein